MQSLGWGLFIFCAIFSLLTSFAWRALAEPPLLRRDLIADTQADPAKEYAHWASLSFHVKLDVGATVSEQPLSGMCVQLLPSQLATGLEILLTALRA